MLFSPTGWLLTLAFLGFILVNAAYLTWTPTLFYRKFGMSLAAAGFHATFWHHVGAAIGVVVGGRISDRLALKDRRWRPWIQVAGLIAGAPFIYLLGAAAEPWLAFAALLVFGLFRGIYDSNLFASLYEVIRPQARATATGLMLAIAFFGGGFAPVLIGRLGERLGLSVALSATSLCYVAGAAAIALAAAVFFPKDAAKATRPAG
jgi:sugar phosphate permease